MDTMLVRVFNVRYYTHSNHFMNSVMDDWNKMHTLWARSESLEELSAAMIFIVQMLVESEFVRECLTFLWFTAVEQDRNWTLQLQHPQFQWGLHLQPPHSGSSCEESQRLQAERLQPSQGPQPQQGVLIQKGGQCCALSQVGCTTISNKGLQWEQYSWISTLGTQEAAWSSGKWWTHELENIFLCLINSLKCLHLCTRWWPLGGWPFSNVISMRRRLCVHFIDLSKQLPGQFDIFCLRWMCLDVCFTLRNMQVEVIISTHGNSSNQFLIWR